MVYIHDGLAPTDLAKLPESRFDLLDLLVEYPAYQWYVENQRTIDRIAYHSVKLGKRIKYVKFAHSHGLQYDNELQ